jgi:ABC-2 type transport system permease protein
LGGNDMPRLEVVSDTALNNQDIDRLLVRAASKNGEHGYAAVLSGSLERPRFTATRTDIDRWRGTIGLIVQHAHEGAGTPPVIETRTVEISEGSRATNRLLTAQLGQMLLFLLTMLLAGMVLSNLVEEKTNKVIEILAASAPIDAIFLGKLFAMLGMAFIGISVWFSAGALVIGLSGSSLPAIAAPAVGWPAFLMLGIAYFAMAYLLLGSLFLGIGGMASTVREVQTLSMPVTMAQLLFFFIASLSVSKTGEPIELFAQLFPFSSPFAMLARAATQAALWPHVFALLWQTLWTGLIIHIGASLFRRNVLKSGRARPRGRSVLVRLFTFSRTS